ncbi:hypothetical protein [Burkholderia contaminans]|uniref:hypothetical protein n=1 Tax=Burkholderia contaminans TaxID=488447 RepID=UPI003D666E8E
MGPYYEREGAVNMGVACHIYSASEDGPRGRGGKDADFIGSEANGIWCCQYHASLVDKANGRDYPASVLFAWKALAEARALKQMNDRPSPLGWVESIEFTEFSRSKHLPKILLSRYSLLTARNGAGKTVLMEAAASVSHARYAKRFYGTTITGEDNKTRPASFRAKVIYSTADSLSKEVRIDIVNNRLTRNDGVVGALLPPGDLEVVYCSCSYLGRPDGKDDLDHMMDILNLDQAALLELARIGTTSVIPGKLKFVQVEGVNVGGDDEEPYPVFKDNDEPFLEIMFKKSGAKKFIPIKNLSGSEQNLLILDLLITKAREISRQRLTLLLIDDHVLNLDEGNFTSLLSAISSEDFQVVVTLPPAREKDVLEEYKGVKNLKKLGYLNPWRLVAISDALK